MKPRPAVASGQRVLYLLRHALPRLAPDGRRYIGWSDPPLSPAGIRQAAAWHAILGRLDLTAAFCSDLQRSRQTAEQITGAGRIAMTIDPDLREINLGDWEGQTFAAVRRSDPRGFEQRGRDPARFRPPGGESFGDLQRRIIPAFEKIIAGTAGDILIVGHAGVNRVILCRLLGMPLKNLFRIGQDYAALNLIVADQIELRVQTLNYSLEPYLKKQKTLEEAKNENQA